MDAPHYVQGQYSVAQRDAIFAKADKYPDASAGLLNQVPTLFPDGSIQWKQVPSGGDGTANANIAIVEDTSTASQAYAVGDLLVYNGQLYRVTAAITQGGTITPGTNVTPTTVADEIEGLDPAISTDTPTGLSGVLFGNGSHVLALALDDASGAASTASLGKAFANLAPVEASSTASQAYAVNSFLGYNGQLYRVTAAIAQGDTLTVGTNIAATDAGTYLAMVAAANAVANAGVAPGGYGLGGISRQLSNTDDLNDITANGWYFWGSSSVPANAPMAGGAKMLVICYGNANDVVQLYYREDKYLVRNRNGTWQPWEWVNPPLAAGTEYRTTERFAGKPVYAKLLDFGALPNATTGTKAHGITNLATVLECMPIEKTLSGGSPWLVRSGITEVYCSSTNAVIVSSTNLSSYSVYVMLKYTKTTD